MANNSRDIHYYRLPVSRKNEDNQIVIPRYPELDIIYVKGRGFPCIGDNVCLTSQLKINNKEIVLGNEDFQKRIFTTINNKDGSSYRLQGVRAFVTNDHPYMVFSIEKVFGM